MLRIRQLQLRRIQAHSGPWTERDADEKRHQLAHLFRIIRP
jgi:hypothetical protein